MKSLAYRIILLALFTAPWLGSTLQAQDEKLTKEVQVVRPYEPTLSDAFKINELPRVEDTISVTPLFNYNLVMRPFRVSSSVSQIPAARMVSEPLAVARKGYARLGFGNYYSPMAEFYFSNERSKTYSYGAWVKHKSLFPKITLDNDLKVRAPHYTTNLTTFGKYAFAESALSGDMSYNHTGYNFYGYDTIPLPDPSVPRPNAEKQGVNNFSVNLNYYSTHSDSTHLNYRAHTGFNHTSDKFDVHQNSFSIHGDFNKYFQSEKVGASMDFIHHTNSPTLSARNSTIFSFAPWIGLFGKQWRVKAGADLLYNAYEKGQKFYIYPKAHLSYNIVSNYVIPYFEFDGYLEDNTYAKILNENPWTKPGTLATNSSHNAIIRGGVKGNMTPRIAYNITASFSLIDSAYFFVNHLSDDDVFSSYFDLAYDNVRKRSILGELTIAPTSSITLSALAQYSSYSMKELERPWHTPNLLGNITARYSIQDKIILKSTFYFEGQRYVMLNDGLATQIKGITNLNLNLEYRYNKRASAFVDINNLLAKRYDLWYLYPTHRFHIMFGVSYAL